MQEKPKENSIFATQPVGILIVKFALPCVTALAVNALYNIVDRIFTGWGVGYLDNGATSVVFPITIIALALAVLVGDGCAAPSPLSALITEAKISQESVKLLS